MVSRDGIDDLLAFTVLLGDLCAQHGMRPFFLMTDRLADVMQQGSPSGQSHVQTQLRSHDAANVGSFPRMIEIVLAVTGPVLQPAQHFDQLRMEIREAQFEDNLFRLFVHQFIDIDFDLFDDLFDPRRMNASIVHQPLK